MEVIRIPQVSLVDATGRRIGVYTDDPDWWQQLKLKHHNHQSMQQITSEAVGQLVTSRQRNVPAISAASMKEKLIDDEDRYAMKSKKSVTNDMVMKSLSISAAVGNHEEMQKECNVIGETPLHIAIMYDDLNTIKFLIETKGFDVNERSVGSKFTGGFNSRLTSNLIDQSKYEGLAYYGEYPLAFAACFASKEIYDYLIEKGADPNLQDSNGNTVLHVLVINNKLDMFQYATNHQMKKASHGIKNNQGLTPINLAAKLGRGDLFEKMLELRNIEFWRYSNITCSAYPLEGLDTIDSEGKVAWNAALSYIVSGNSDGHLDMLDIGVVNRLLGDKWETYAKRRLIMRLISSAIHLIFLTIAVYTRATDTANLWVWPTNSANTIIRYLSELAIVICSFIQLVLQCQEIYTQGLKYYLKNLTGEPANVLYQFFNIFIILAVPFRFVEFDKGSSVTARNVEDTLFILAIPCGWMHLLFYARVFPLTGPFVVMIYKMIVGDILTFASIYVLLLFGFSLAFYYLYKNAAPEIETMHSYVEALMISFQMTLGEFKARLPEFDQIYYSDFTKTVFIAFMLMMHILLLNMLIAMMGNTYHQITKRSEKEWKKQWAGVILLLERSISPQDLKKFQNQYGITLPSKQPGLMVIRKIDKTKAFQKTANIRNWKRFIKGVRRLLKEHPYRWYELLEAWECKDNRDPVKKSKDTKKQFDWAIYNSKTDDEPNTLKLDKKNRKADKKIDEDIKLKKSPSDSKGDQIIKEPIKELVKELIPKENKLSPMEITSDVLKEGKMNVKEQSKVLKESVKDASKTNTKNSTKTTPIEVKQAKQEVKQPESKNIIPKPTTNKKTDQSLTVPILSPLSPPLVPPPVKPKLADTKENTNFFSVDEPQFIRQNTNRITFYPVQSNKIYPQMTNSFSSVNSEPTESSDNKTAGEVCLTPNEDILTSSNLISKDIKRPLSSVKHNPESYMKRDTYPKFPQSILQSNNDEVRINDSESDSSSGMFKTRTSPDGDESKEKDQKL